MPTPKPLSILHARSCRGVCVKRLSARSGAWHKRRSNAFTLVELLVVLVIIMILTGMVLAAAGYVSKKGAHSRAEAEMTALAAALEAYKGDNGNYPRDPINPSSTDNLDANSIAGGDPTGYQKASRFLYGQLSGDYDNSSPTASTNYNYAIDTANELANRAYFTFPPGMLSITPAATKN